MDVIDHCENNFSKVLGGRSWNPEEKRDITLCLWNLKKKITFG